jgi:hypothetical protein
VPFSLLLANLPADDVVTAPDDPVPLAGVFDSGSWAIADLTLASLAFLTFLALAAVFLYRYFFGFDRQADSGTAAGWGSRADGRPTDAQLLMLSQALPWLMASALSAMLTVFLFAFSQDFNGTMLSFDRWSLVMLALYATQIGCTIKALQRSAVSRQAPVAGDLEPGPDDVPGTEGNTASKRHRVKLRSNKTGFFEDDIDSRHP